VFDSVLIANRGEIARRIVRTARRMGVKAIAVYSDADSELPYVREADVAGTVVGILVEDGAPVEYGQPLFRITP